MMVPRMAVALLVLPFFVFTGCSKRVTSSVDTGMPGGPASTAPSMSDEMEMKDDVGGRVSGSPTEQTLQPAVATSESASELSATQPAELADVFFDYDQAIIRSGDTTVLDRNAVWLNANRDKRIQIEGHSDERGTSEYNLTLSERRAKAAAGYLAEMGVDTSQVSIVPYGKERPFCTVRDEACYQKNRRAHFVVK